MSPVRALRESLFQELRRRPFRPLLLEDMRLLRPEAEPADIRISRDGFRTLYENALVFTRGILTPFEVGFFLDDGEVGPHEAFQAYKGLRVELLEKGLAEVHAGACGEWERLSRGRFDPNDEDKMMENGWFRMIALPDSVMDSLPADDAFILSMTDMFSFLYQSGMVSCCVVPHMEGGLHTHTITHVVAEAYFPSKDDANHSPNIWLILDAAFIKATMASSLGDEEKARKIIDYHVDRMSDAVCIGSKIDDTGLKVLVNK